MDPAERRHELSRRPRHRFSRTRALRAFIHMPGSVNLLVGLAALAVVVAVGAVVLDVHYHDPRSDRTLGPFESLYLALSLVVVSPVAALPDDSRRGAAAGGRRAVLGPHADHR